jgi:hypothetical protein
MTYNAIMRWGIYVVAATSVLAGTSCLRARAASDTHMACGATLAVPEPIRLSILPVQTGHKSAATCAAQVARPAITATILAQTDSCEQDPTDPNCVCAEGENDADCVGGVHRG